jgi:hypothetical protein
MIEKITEQPKEDKVKELRTKLREVAKKEPTTTNMRKQNLL